MECQRDRSPERNSERGQFSSEKTSKFNLLEPKYYTTPEKQLELQRYDRIGRAKHGFEIFKKIYDSGDESIKDILTKGEKGVEIQALFLGLKPQVVISFTISSISQKSLLIELLKAHAQEDIVVKDKDVVLKDVKDAVVKVFLLTIYSKSSAERVIRQYPGYFPDYTGQPIESYLSERDGFSPEKKLTDEEQIRTGLFFGYPHDDVKQFVDFSEPEVKFRGLTTAAKLGLLGHNDTALSERDKKLLSEIEDAYRKIIDAVNIDAMRKSSNEYSNFIKNKEEEIFRIMDRLPHRFYPGISENAKKHAVYNRTIGARGFLYLSSDPDSDRTKAFLQKIDETFKESGMDEFLEQIKRK